MINEDIKYSTHIEKDKLGRGEIRYRIYEDGIAEFMGSYVNTENRGEGVFTELLNVVLEKLKGKLVYIPVSNSKIVPMFKRQGFEVTNDYLRYWGKPDNSINVVKQL